MRFCSKCDFMLYLAVKDESLMFYCRSCGNVEVPEDTAIVADKTTFTRDKKSWNLFVNKYTKYDPTLFRDNAMECPNGECITNRKGKEDKDKQESPETAENPSFDRQVIHLRYDDENMKYLYLCFHCDYVWNTEG